MLKAGWVRHCEQNEYADPGYLDEYNDDVFVEVLDSPACYRDGTLIANKPALPTVEQIVALATDESKGSPVRASRGDEDRSVYGRPWEDPWVHSPDVFCYDEVAALFNAIGVPGYVETTGGGCATIYAGPLVPFESVIDRAGNTETEQRYKVAAGPGHFGWGQPSVGTVEEFYIGLNDEGESDPPNAGDLGVTNTRQLAALIALYVIDAADFDNVEAIGLDATHRGIPQKGQS
jgi:hypothetical protein